MISGKGSYYQSGIVFDQLGISARARQKYYEGDIRIVIVNSLGYTIRWWTEIGDPYDMFNEQGIIYYYKCIVY